MQSSPQLTFDTVELTELFGGTADDMTRWRPLDRVDLDYRRLTAWERDLLVPSYHRRRNYLGHLLPRLRQLEQDGRVVIEAGHRQYFGTRLNDTFSTVVWRPA